MADGISVAAACVCLLANIPLVSRMRENCTSGLTRGRTAACGGAPLLYQHRGTRARTRLISPVSAFHEGGEQTPLGNQIGVFPLFHDPTTIEHEDPIAIP